MLPEYETLIQNNLEDDELEKYIVRKKTLLKNAGFKNREINKHLDLGLLPDINKSIESNNYDDQIYVNSKNLLVDTKKDDNLPETKEELQKTVDARNKKLKTIYENDNQYINTVSANINKIDGNNSPRLSAQLGNGDPLGYINKELREGKERAEKDEKRRDKISKHVILSDYIDNQDLNQMYDLKENEIQNVLKFLSIYAALTSNSINGYNPENNDESGIYNRSTKGLAEDKARYISFYKNLFSDAGYDFEIPKWLDNDNAGDIGLVRNQTILEQTYLLSDEIPIELQQRILNGDITGSLREYALLRQQNISEEKINDMIRRVETKQYTEGGPNAAIWQKDSPAPTFLKNMLGGYGTSNIIDNGLDSSLFGSAALFNGKRIRFNMKTLDDAFSSGDIIDAFIENKGWTDDQKQEALMEQMQYNNQSVKRGFFQDLITVFMDMPFYGLGALADIGSKTSGTGLFLSSFAHGLAFAIPTVGTNTFHNAIMNDKADTYEDFMDELLTKENAILTGKSVVVGGALRYGNVKVNKPRLFYLKKYNRNMRNEIQKNVRQGPMFRDPREALGYLKKNYHTYLFQPNKNLATNIFTNLGYTTAALGTLNPLVFEHRLPGIRDYIHAAAFATAFTAAGIISRGLHRNLFFERKAKEYSSIFDTEAVVKDPISQRAILEGRAPSVYHTADQMIKKVLKDKYNVNMIEPYKFKLNENALAINNNKTYTVKDIVNYNNIPVAIVKDNVTKQLKSIFPEELAKLPPGNTEMVITPTGEEKAMQNTKTLLDSDLATTNIERSKISPEDETFVLEAKKPSVKVKVSGKGYYLGKKVAEERELYHGRIIQPKANTTLFRLRQELIQEQGVEDLRFGMLNWKRNEYLVGEYDNSYIPLSLIDTSRALYKKNDEGTLVPRFVNGFNEGYFTKMFPERMLEQGLTEKDYKSYEGQMFDFEELMNINYKKEFQKITIIQTENNETFGFDKATNDMLKIFNIRYSVPSLAAYDVPSMFYEKYPLIKWVYTTEYMQQLKTGNVTLPLHEQGALVYFDIQNDLLMPRNFIRPLDISKEQHIIEPYKLPEIPERFVPNNTMDLHRVDPFNPEAFTGKNSTEVYNKLFVGTGLNIFELLVLAERIMQKPVDANTPYNDIHLKGSLGYFAEPQDAARGVEINIGEKIDKTKGKDKYKVPIQLAVRKEFFTDPKNRFSLGMTLAHEIGHLLDWYDKEYKTRNLETDIPVMMDRYQEVMDALRESGALTGYFGAPLTPVQIGNLKTGETTVAPRTVPGMFSFERLAEETSGKFKKVDPKDYENLFEKYIGRGNMLGHLMSLRGFGREFFDPNNNEGIARGSQQFKDMVRTAEAEATKKEKRTQSALLAIFAETPGIDVKPYFVKDAKGERLQNSIDRDPAITDILEEFIPRDLLRVFDNFSINLKNEILKDALQLLDKNTRTILLESIGPQNQGIRREFQEDFVKAFEEQFMKRDIIALHIVHREMRFLSNQIRPIDLKSYLDSPHKVFSNVKVGGLGDAFFGGPKIQPRESRDVREGFGKLDKKYIFPTMQEILDYTPLEYKDFLHDLAKAGYEVFDKKRIIERDLAQVFAYYNNSKELFADYMSVFLLYPEYASLHAPTTTKLFLEHIGQKPELEKIYLDVKGLMADKGDGSNRILENIKTLKETMDKATKDVKEAQKEFDPDFTEHWWQKPISKRFDFKKTYYDLNVFTSVLDLNHGRSIREYGLSPERTQPWYKRMFQLDIFQDTNRAMTKEREILWHLNHTHTLQSKIEEVFGERLQPVFDKAREAYQEYGLENGPNWFGVTMLLLNIGEGKQRRGEVLNTYGITSLEKLENALDTKTAEKILPYLKNDFTAERGVKELRKAYPKLIEAVEEFFEIAADDMLHYAKGSFLFSMEEMVEMKNNKYTAQIYAHKLIERLQKDGDLGDYQNPKHQTQGGSLGALVSPLEQTLKKMIRLRSDLIKSKIITMLANPVEYDLKTINDLYDEAGLQSSLDKVYDPLPTSSFDGSLGYLRTEREFLAAYKPDWFGGSAGEINFERDALNTTGRYKGYKLDENGERIPIPNKELEGRVIKDLGPEDYYTKKEVRLQIEDLKQKISNLKYEGVDKKTIKDMEDTIYKLEQADKIAKPGPKHMTLVKVRYPEPKKLVLKYKPGPRTLGKRKQKTIDSARVTETVDIKTKDVYINTYFLGTLGKNQDPFVNVLGLQTLRGLNKFFKSVYTSYNIKFGYFNLQRDPQAISRKTGMPLLGAVNPDLKTRLKKELATTLDQHKKYMSEKGDVFSLESIPVERQPLMYAKLIVSQIPKAYNSTVDARRHDAIQQELNRRLLMLPKRELDRAYEAGEMNDPNVMLTEIMKTLGIQDGVDYHMNVDLFNSKYLKNGLNETLYKVHAATKSTEIAPRTAFLLYVDRMEKQTGIKIDPKLVDLEIGRIATPYYPARGSSAPYLELLWPFYSAQMNSWRTEKTSLRRDPAVYFARAIYNNPWLIFETLAVAGFFGTAIAIAFQDIDEEEKAINKVFPLLNFGEVLPGTNTKRFQLHINIKKDHAQMAYDEITRRAILGALKLGGWDKGPSGGELDEISQKRANQIMKTLGVSPPIVFEFVAPIVKYFANGTIPVSNFTGYSGASKNTEYLSEQGKGFSDRMEFFGVASEAWINNVGIISPLGIILDVDEDQQLKNKKDAYTTIMDKLLLPGQILKSTFSVTDRLEKNIKYQEAELKHDLAKFKYDMNKLYASKKLKDFNEMEQAMHVYYMEFHPDAYLKSMLIHTPSPSLSKFELNVANMSPQRRNYHFGLIQKKYNLNGPQYTQDEKDALKKSREDAKFLDTDRIYDKFEQQRFGVDKFGNKLKK